MRFRTTARRCRRPNAKQRGRWWRHFFLESICSLRSCSQLPDLLSFSRLRSIAEKELVLAARATEKKNRNAHFEREEKDVCSLAHSTDAFSFAALSLTSTLDPLPRQPNQKKKKQDDDLALAKALQEQERAFMLLASSATPTGAGGAAAAAPGGGGRGGEKVGGGEKEEEAALDDEALAWRLQEEMEREHMLALAGMLPGQRRQLGEEGAAALAAAGGGGGGGAGGGGEGRAEAAAAAAAADEGEDEEEEEEEEEEEDPAALSYERLTALTDVVGVVPKKASTSALSKIVVGPYRPRRAGSGKGGGGGGGGEGKKGAENGVGGGGGGKEEEEEGEEEQCAVCRVELEKGEDTATLPCGHAYHEGCVLAWLERAKSCPVCGVELEGE